jgi:hypothetical protein
LKRILKTGIRSATLQTREAVLAFENEDVKPNQKLKLVHDCSKVHSTIVKMAAMGRGFDRHFFGLKYTAERLGRPINPLFTHRMYDFKKDEIM